MSAPSLVLAQALRGGAVLVSRPGRVSHLYSGDLTPSGKFVPTGHPVLCKTRTGRLQVVEGGLGSLVRVDVEVCRRCMAASLAIHRRRPGDRDSEIEFFSCLTVDDFAHAARLCGTVQEVHAVSTAATRVLGPPPPLHLKLTDPDKALRQTLERHINSCRRVLADRELTDEEREQIDAARAERRDEDARIQHARKQEESRGRTLERQRSGSYLMPHERPTG